MYEHLYSPLAEVIIQYNTIQQKNIKGYDKAKNTKKQNTNIKNYDSLASSSVHHRQLVL